MEGDDLDDFTTYTIDAPQFVKVRGGALQASQLSASKSIICLTFVSCLLASLTSRTCKSAKRKTPPASNCGERRLPAATQVRSWCRRFETLTQPPIRASTLQR
jgi:hypothetical protein